MESATSTPSGAAKAVPIATMISVPTIAFAMPPENVSVSIAEGGTSVRNVHEIAGAPRTTIWARMATSGARAIARHA